MIKQSEAPAQWRFMQGPDSVFFTQLLIVSIRAGIMILMLRHSENCPIKHSNIREEEWSLARDVEQHHVQRPLQAKLAGRIPETPGSPRYLIRLSQVTQSVGIYANGSPRDIDGHQASVVEAKYARTLQNGNIPLGASVGNGYIIPVRAQRAVGEAP